MEFISDLILAAASLGAAVYCVVLSRRLKALGALEGSVGTAIAVLSRQVDDLARSLKAAQETAARAGGRLDGQTDKAEAVARRLELLVASMHDLPATRTPTQPARAPSPWPTEAGRRAAPPPAAPEPEPEPEPEQAPRARVLRRRQGPGAF